MYSHVSPPTLTILIAGLGERVDAFLVPELEKDGYRIQTAQGQAAILNALTSLPDLILLDLPGFEVLEQLAALRAIYQGAILVVGPPRNSRLLVQTLDSGADEYLGRPFRTDELLARIRAKLRRR
ncbi:MAG: response regulator [Oscillochloridaceae bacterium umkhey_bin13]